MKKRLAILSIIIVLIGGGLAYLFSHIDLIPRPASTQMESIDSLLKILFSIASVIFTVVIVFFIHALISSRRRQGDLKEGPAWRGFGPLELTWTLIPLAIVVALGVYGGIVLNRMTGPPPPSQTEMEVDVLAFRWGWQFTYPDYNIQSFELELPVNQPILFRIQSRDVVHSFWVPEFGPKQDAVPGMTTELRLTPTTIGRYQVLCSQLCGMGHTFMTAPAIVVSQSDFQKWVQSQPKSTPTPTPPVTPSPTQSPSPSPTTTPTSVTINLIAENIAFNLSAISVPAGATVTINFDNRDSGIPHNFAVYNDSSAAPPAIFQGQIITGPATITYTFKAPSRPGTYFFRCDVHPTIMTGSFIVQ